MVKNRWIIFLTAVILLGGCTAAPTAASQLPVTGAGQVAGAAPVNLPVVLPTFPPIAAPTQTPIPAPTAAPSGGAADGGATGGGAVSGGAVSGGALPFAVTGVDTGAALDGYTYSYTCQATYTFQANITTTGSGTVRYHWLRSDGSTTRQASLDFSGSQIQQVRDIWTIASNGANVTGSDQLVIDQPAGQTYAPAAVSVYCAPPAPPKKPKF